MQAVLMVSQLRSIDSIAEDFSAAFGREVRHHRQLSGFCECPCIFTGSLVPCSALTKLQSDCMELPKLTVVSRERS